MFLRHLVPMERTPTDLREPRQTQSPSLHFQLSHMAVHHHLFRHIHYHRLHLLWLVQSFILNLRLGSSANPFLHRPFPHLPDWFYELSDHLMFLFCSTAGFVCMVCNTKPALSRFSNALKNHCNFHHSCQGSIKIT